MATSTDIQILDENGAIVSWGEFAQWEDDGTDDIRPSFPIIKIVQGTSTMDGAGKHGGDFWHSDLEDFTPALDVVALVRRQTRAMFEADSNTPVCMSADARAPLPNQPLWDGRKKLTIKVGSAETDYPVPQVVPSLCADCPFSQWGKNDEPPLCKNSDVFLVDRASDPEHPDLAQLRLAGKSIRPANQFIATKCKPKRIPLYAYRLHIQTTEKSEPGKKWHEVQLSGELMKPSEALAYSTMLAAYRAEFEKTLAEGERVERWEDETGRVTLPDPWAGADAETGELPPEFLDNETEWKTLNAMIPTFGLTESDVALVIGPFSRAAFDDWRRANPTKTIGSLISESAAEADKAKGGKPKDTRPLSQRLGVGAK